jgi:alkylhydroperoxidase family enzyme
MRTALGPLSSDGRRHPAPPRSDPERGRAALALFAHHPALAARFFEFNGHVLWDTTLTPRQRQLLILRVAARRRSTYVQQEHRTAARHAGLTDDEIANIVEGSDVSGWEPLEAALLRAADELIDDGGVSDATWAALASELDVEQLVDMVFTVGCYETTSLFFRTFGLEADR